MYRHSYFEAKFSNSRTGGGTARPLVYSDFASSQTGTLPIPAIHFQLFLHPIGALQPAGRTQHTVGHHLVECASIVIVQTALHYRFPWKQAVNILTIGGAVLAVYCLMEVVNPTASLEAWIYSRGFIYNTFLVSLITVLLATSYKQISRLIFLFSILTLIAILKGLCQKFIGFDAVEYNAMMESGMYKTHLLPQITRYFSIFTDAGITVPTWDSPARCSVLPVCSARSPA